MSSPIGRTPPPPPPRVPMGPKNQPSGSKPIQDVVDATLQTAREFMNGTPLSNKNLQHLMIKTKKSLDELEKSRDKPLSSDERISQYVNTIEKFEKISRHNQALLDKEVSVKLDNWPEKLQSKVKENNKRISSLHSVGFRETEVMKNLENIDARDFPYKLAPSSKKLLGEYLALQKKLSINPLDLTGEACQQLCNLADAFDTKVKAYNKVLLAYEGKIEEIKSAKAKGEAKEAQKNIRNAQLQAQTNAASANHKPSTFVSRLSPGEK